MFSEAENFIPGRPDSSKKVEKTGSIPIVVVVVVVVVVVDDVFDPREKMLPSAIFFFLFIFFGSCFGCCCITFMVECQTPTNNFFVFGFSEEIVKRKIQNKLAAWKKQFRSLKLQHIRVLSSKKTLCHSLHFRHLSPTLEWHLLLWKDYIQFLPCCCYEEQRLHSNDSPRAVICLECLLFQELYLVVVAGCSLGE